MKDLEGKIIEGVYASYAVTPASEKILRGISEEIANTILSAVEGVKKSDIIIPTHYHMSLDEKHNLSSEEISTYKAKIIAKKKSIILDDTLPLSKISWRESNRNGRSIIYARPSKRDENRIPFQVGEKFNAHITLANVANTPFFHAWLASNFHLFSSARERALAKYAQPLQIDTTKIYIRGKVDGVKKILAEV